MTTAERPPGPRGLPFVGNTLQWIRDPCAFRERCAEEYGRVVNYEILGMDAYMLTEPEDVRRVLVEEPDRFRRHQKSNEQLKNLIGNGLITSDGELWRRQRKAIQPAFTMDNIRRCAEVMIDRSADRVERWSDGDTVDVTAEMLDLTLVILVETMFGSDVDLDSRGLFEAAEDVREPMKPRNQPITFFAPDWAPVPMLRRFEAALEHIDEQVRDIIAQRRAGDEDRDDLLSTLLASEAEMSDEQIRDEMVTFLFAGHETTALSLTFALHLLSGHPDIEARLHEELDDVLEGDRPTVEDTFDLEYTGAVVEEAMRLYPPAHEIRREPAEDVEFGGYSIPEGALVVLPSWVLHRDERFWEKPEAFRPERFLPADDDRRPGGLRTEDERPDFAYFPFGGGPRHCIGRRFATTEDKLVLATLCSSFSFERLYDEIDLAASVSLQPENDVEMRVRRR